MPEDRPMSHGDFDSHGDSMNHGDRDCGRIQQQLWRYVDRELPARELAEISEALRDCPACRQAYEDRAKDARLYRMAFSDVDAGKRSEGREGSVSAPRGPSSEDAFLVRFRAEFDREGLGKINDRRAQKAESAFGNWMIDEDFDEKGSSDESAMFEGLPFEMVDETEESRRSGRDPSNQRSSNQRSSSQRRGGGVWGRRSGMRRDVDRKFIELRGSSPQRRRRMMIVAALLFLIPATVGIGIFLTSQRGEGIGVYQVAGTGSVEVERPDGTSHIAVESDTQSTVEPSIFRAGTTFQVREGVELELKIGDAGLGQSRVARLRLKGPAKFEVLEHATMGGFHGRLHSGEVHCSVKKLGTGESFRIDTETHGVEVVGTVFTVYADGREPLVTEGKVAFGALSKARDIMSRRYLEPKAEVASKSDEASATAAEAAKEASENLQPTKGAGEAASDADASRSGEAAKTADASEATTSVDATAGNAGASGADEATKAELDRPSGSTRSSGGGIQIDDDDQ